MPVLIPFGSIKLDSNAQLSFKIDLHNDWVNWYKVNINTKFKLWQKHT